MFSDLDVDDEDVDVDDELPGCGRPAEQHETDNELLQPPGDRVEHQRCGGSPQVLALRPRHRQDLSLGQNTTVFILTERDNFKVFREKIKDILFSLLLLTGSSQR